MSSDPDEMLAKARHHRKLGDFAEGEHWYKVYLLARPKDEDARKELISMAEFASARHSAEKVRQLAALCAHHFKIETDVTELSSAARQSDTEEIRAQAASLNAQILGRIREAWNLNADESPWPEALRRGDKMQNWKLVEWILRNCEVDLETSWLFELKVDAAELLDLLKEFPNPRSLDLQNRLRQALKNSHGEVLQTLIEKGLEAMDDDSGDDGGSVGRAEKPPPPPPRGDSRRSPIPRNADQE